MCRLREVVVAAGGPDRYLDEKYVSQARTV